MKTKMYINEPEKVEFTLNITMRLDEWELLYKQLLEGEEQYAKYNKIDWDNNINYKIRQAIYEAVEKIKLQYLCNDADKEKKGLN